MHKFIIWKAIVFLDPASFRYVGNSGISHSLSNYYAFFMLNS